MPRPRFILTRRTWIPGLVLALSMTSLLVIGEMFTDDPAAAAVSPGVTLRASVADNETQGQDSSGNPSISADGRYVAFDSTYPFDPFEKSNDGPYPSLNSDVYVRDTVAGTTTLISHGREAPPSTIKRVQPNSAVAAAALTPRVPAYGPSQMPSISADGRYIAFYTTASNIPVEGSGDRPRVVICDRDPDGDGTFAGECVDRVVSRSEGAGTVETYPKMSADATLIVYNCRGCGTTEAFPKLILGTLGRDPAGVIPTPQPADFTVVRPPTDIDGRRYFLASIGSFAVSADGSHVGLTATYRDSEGGPGLRHLVYDYDVASRALARMDVDEAGLALPDQFRRDVALSGDGRRFAFVEDMGAVGPVVRLYDRDPDADGVWYPADGEPLAAELGSRNKAGAVVPGVQPAFSADGRYFAFVTDAGNVHNGVDDPTFNSCMYQSDLAAYEVPADAHDGVPVVAQATTPPVLVGRSNCDVVVRDLVVDRQRESTGLPRLAAELASPSRLSNCRAFTAGATCEGGDDSGGPVLTANGSAVAYDSWAPDLVPADSNSESDVFVRRFTPTLRADPVDFGTVELGQSAIRAVPVQHVGFGPLTGGPVAIGGPNAGDFTVFPSQNCTGAILHATEQCVISVQFRPSVAGARAGELQVGPAGAPQPGKIPLAGTGKEPPPGYRATPNPLAFGERGVLTPSAVQTVTVTNTGRGPLQLTAVTLTGTAPTGFPGDYEITGNTCLAAPVAAGGSCQVSVRHVPKAIGVRPAVLQIVEAGDPPVVHGVDLTGTGLAPAIAVKPPLAPPGQVVRVTGTNFPPGSTVRLALDGMPGQVRMDVAGDGTLSTQFLVLPHTATGRRLLRAVVIAPFPAGLAGTVQATTEFLVVPGSLQPPDFTVRK